MSRYDARAWLVWLAAGALLTILSRNPLYLLILLAISRIVEEICADPGGRGFQLPFWRLAIAIIVFSTLFNMLTAHVGGTVVARLPDSWWIIGGPLTAEAAVYGFVSGLSLVTILSFFLAFNAIVPVSQLARLTPRAFHELGLVLLLAVTFVPEVTGQWQRVREAQAIRGHRVRALSDWRSLALPLLIGGLERSMNLAETMVSRGYTSVESRGTQRRTKLFLLVGLVFALGGVLALVWQHGLGWAMMAAAAGAILVGMWSAGRDVVVTRYRVTPWTWRDSAIVASALAPFFLLYALPGANASLAYSPYPALTMPAFHTLVGLALLLLLVPAGLTVRR
jgi:energy-coupling factor transport system permease protein